MFNSHHHDNQMLFCVECQGVVAATLYCKKNNKKNDYQLVVANRSRRKEASWERMRLQRRLIL
jgi:hypothetical protein